MNRIKYLSFLVVSVILAGSCTPEPATTLMPGTKYFDVTDPSIWGE